MLRKYRTFYFTYYVSKIQISGLFVAKPKSTLNTRPVVTKRHLKREYEIWTHLSSVRGTNILFLFYLARCLFSIAFFRFVPCHVDLVFVAFDWVSLLSITLLSSDVKAFRISNCAIVKSVYSLIKVYNKIVQQFCRLWSESSSCFG